MILIANGRTQSNGSKLAKVFNNSFVHVVRNLHIHEEIDLTHPNAIYYSNSNSVFRATRKCKNLPNIMYINISIKELERPNRFRARIPANI